MVTPWFMNFDVFLELGLHYKEVEFWASQILPTCLVFVSMSWVLCHLYLTEGETWSDWEIGPSALPHSGSWARTNLGFYTEYTSDPYNDSEKFNSGKKKKKKTETESNESSHVCFHFIFSKKAQLLEKLCTQYMRITLSFVNTCKHGL